MVTRVMSRIIKQIVIRLSSDGHWIIDGHQILIGWWLDSHLAEFLKTDRIENKTQTPWHNFHVCLILFFQKENPRVWPICLPEKSNDNPNHLQFRGIKVLGYGPQDDEDLMLTAVDLNVKPLPICNEKYTVGQSNRNFWEILDSLPTKFDGGSVFCASNVATDDATCRGDSGGPATFFDGIKHRQLGVVHGSITSCDGSRFPSIFVRIDNPEVYDWIAKVTSSDLVIGKVFWPNVWNFNPWGFWN